MKKGSQDKADGTLKNHQDVHKIMVKQIFIALALVFLLAAPVAMAQTTEEQIWPGRQVGEQQSWRVLEQNFEDTNAVKTDEFTWFKFTGYPKAINTSILTIEITATITTQENQAGVWRYTVQMVNGGGMVDLGACFWNHQTFNAGVLGGNLVTRTTYVIPCAAAVDVPEDSNITYWINRTVLSGSPTTPLQTHVSIIGDRGDFVVTSAPTAFEDLTGATGLEFLAFIAIITLAIVTWSRSKDEIVQVFCGVVLGLFGGIAISLYQEWIGWVPFGVLISVLGFYFIVRSAIDWITDRA